MIDFIRKYNCYQLGNSCKDQIGVKCFLILSSSSGQTKIILDVVNISFYGGSDFVGVIPFFCTTNSSRIGTKVFFRINIHHSAARGSRAWNTACAVRLMFSSKFVFESFDFRTDEIVPGNTASEFGCYYLDANEAVKAESNNSENTF